MLYRLAQLTQCSAGSDPLTSQSAEVGLGWLKCAECNDEPGEVSEEQEERGCHRFGLMLKARRPFAIDYTGNKAHDRVSFCPRSCLDPEQEPPGRVSNHSIREGLQKFRKVKACGGLADYNGQAPADSPPRVSWFYATVEGVVARYQAEVKDTQTQLQNAVVAALTKSPRIPDDG